MALAGVDHLDIGAAHRLERVGDRLQGPRGVVEVVPHDIHIAFFAAEIGLHINRDEGGTRRIHLDIGRVSEIRAVLDLDLDQLADRRAIEPLRELKGFCLFEALIRLLHLRQFLVAVHAVKGLVFSQFCHASYLLDFIYG